MRPGRRFSERAFLASVFALCLALYLLSAAGRIQGGDDSTMYSLTRNLVERGEISIVQTVVEVPAQTAAGFLPTRAYEIETVFAVPGRAGKFYCKYGPAQSLLAVPFYLLGRGVSAFDATHDPQIWTKLCVALLVNPLISALGCAALAALARQIGASRRASLLLALLYGFATLAWAYAKSFFSEPAVALLFLVAALCLARLHAGHALRDMALAGACLGAAMLFRATAAIAAPAFIVAAALMLAERRAGWLDLRRWLAFLAGPLAAAGVILGYNFLRFGAPLSTGYAEVAWNTPALAGLYGLLFSPGKSLFLYAPATLAASAGLPLLWRRSRPLAALTALLSVTYVLFHAPYNYWSGGWNWGPRFLLPAVPFLVLALAPLLEKGVNGGRVVVGALALTGLLVTLPAILVDHSRHLIALSERFQSDYYERSIFQPVFSPVVNQPGVALDVLRRFAQPQARATMRSILAGAPSIQPANALSLERAGARLVWQDELLRLNAPDLWYSHLALCGYISAGAAGACAGVLAAAVFALAAWTLRTASEEAP